MNTYAFIVGIETYGEKDYTVQGPCANAIAVARWLLEIGTPGKNIHIFLDPGDPAPNIDDLRKAEVHHHGSATKYQIDDFWKKELAKDCPPGSRLFVFWSGHGGTGPERRRLLLCHDYEQITNDRFFDITNFLEHLKTGPFQCFNDQIALVDVCGVHLNCPVGVQPDPAPKFETHQLAYFATPEGRYAAGEEGRGVFTNAALSVLKNLPGEWPVQKEFVHNLEDRLRALKAPGFRIARFYDEGEQPETVVGIIPATGNRLADSVKDLLDDLDIVSGIFIPHYRRTVECLGMPGLETANGLDGIVRELSSLRDTDGTTRVPYGLLQFLKRLASEKNLSARIEAWLSNNAAKQANTLKEIQEELDLETAKIILVILVDVDEQGMLSGYTPYLCNSKGALVAEQALKKAKVRDWKAFERSLKDVLAKFVEGGVLSNVEIHFVVDISLFHKPFHRIPAPNGGTIGEQAVVVLRPRFRLLSSDIDIHRNWRKYAFELRGKPPKSLKWMQIHANVGVLPKEKGLCFAGFARTDKNETKVLLRLLRQGAPCLYIPHPESPNSNWKWDWDGLSKYLTELLANLETIERLPNNFAFERNNGEDFACKAAIVWDDPPPFFVNPFTKTEGPRTA